MRAEQVSLKEKEYLNPQEAIKHWNLSNRKFYNFLKEGPYNFIAYYGTRKLIIRTVFDKYLNENPSIKEALANGEGPGKKRLEA